MWKSIFKSSLFFAATVLLESCTKDKIPPTYQGYPEEIGKIFINSCAVSGCHNEKSHEATAGLNLSSWEKLFSGGHSGAVVIPFAPEQSPLLFFINTYSDLGQRLTPTMPLNSANLSKESVITIRDWIANGAADNGGFVKFSDIPGRKKFYVANQGCDQVTIFDSETKLAMRYVKVGKTDAAESPHMIRVSPDGKYWYACFLNSTALQKFNTSDDSPAGNIEIGTGFWNTFIISSDSKKAFVVSWEADGKVAEVDLENMKLVSTIGGNGFIKYPHGSAINMAGTILYLTAQTGNFIYKIPVNDPGNYEEIVLDPTDPVIYGSKYDGHEIVFSPDESKYFVSCTKSNEVRVMKTADDTWMATIPNIYSPLEMGISKSKGFLLVTSSEDTVSYPGKRGSVSVIDVASNSFVKKIFTGFQPHGLGIDEEKNLVYVANRNTNPSGPAPHHSSTCGGRNGYVTAIDLNSLEILPKFNAEVLTDPYSVAVRK